MSSASPSRRCFVSSRFAESIQPTYARRYDGAKRGPARGNACDDEAPDGVESPAEIAGLEAKRRSVGRYFRPSVLPAASMSSASPSRRCFVSSRFAESIQPTYARRYDGAKRSKCRQALGLVFSRCSI